MYLKNVFYGFTTDGKDRCLWRKVKVIRTDLGDVNKTVFYDLDDKVEFDINEVDLPTLQPITNIIGRKKWMGRRKVKSIYQADRQKLIDVKGAFYGQIIRKYYTLNPETSIYDKPTEDVLCEKALFARVNDPIGRSLNLQNSNLYNRSERVEYGTCVREYRPIDHKHFYGLVAPKRKLLEMDYRKEL